MPLPLSLRAFVADTPAAPRRAAAAAVTASEPADDHLLVEVYEAAAMAAWREAWAELAGRALEPNAFMEPDFALTLAEHLPMTERPAFITVRSLPADGPHRLVGLCPVVRERAWLGLRLSIWRHDLVALGLPLLDRHHAVPALVAILDWIRREHPRCLALQAEMVPAEGPTLHALRQAAAASARPLRLIDPRRRAMLEHGAGAAGGLAALSPRRRKEALRQRRRLADGGALSYVSTTGAAEVAIALERFLDLEAAGWKGGRGTALKLDPARAAFTRAMTAAMAAGGCVRIDSLDRNGPPLAMGIVLSSGGRDFFWKMAYAEDQAALSPGVQFVLELTERQAARSGTAATDSCALPDHSMIDRLWPGRLGLVDVAIGLRPGRTVSFEAFMLIEAARRRIRALAKRAVATLRKRVRPRPSR
ncbi:MAG TPA: GNAT family N-acetyltransferase [Lichenihabitans sp.]|jgi:CelD/BcsL family acetyltransferase involved in cellulose biosynthesis|nr:GNAT family N-acetyltransferase [Lichenihabitans sp.]